MKETLGIGLILFIGYSVVYALFTIVGPLGLPDNLENTLVMALSFAMFIGGHKVFSK